ncbi:MAG: diaminopimelate decarboxylase [Candidatus Omnitrophica bacterium]|nr:diaminopimelate decarboxylase [Candidatus Omnitrophota bacterium]
MHEFKYRNKQLYCEGVKIQDLVKRFSTPLYVYSYHTILGHFIKLKIAFKKSKPLICYSVKANSNLAILRALVKEGAGLDIVSGGELFRAIKVGCPPERIVYAGVGKTEKEIKEAIKIGILFFNVESISELENINGISKRLNKITNVAIRINPDVEPKTHRFITTGRLTNKFGVDFKTAYKILKMRKDFKFLNISGLHIHIGSQITSPLPYVSAIGKLLNFIRKLRKEGIELEYLNIGGGLGIIYNKETPQTAEEFAKRLLPLLKKSNLKIIMEPGRFIVGNAGVLVTKVLYIKSTSKKKFVIVDAGMNDLIRPALYDAYHNILPLKMIPQRKGNAQKVDIVGPICESADFFAKNRTIPKLKENHYLAIMGAGAYGFSMSSNYNSRCRPAEVLVKEDKFYLIREREAYNDLIDNEVIPEFLR